MTIFEKAKVTNCVGKDLIKSFHFSSTRNDCTVDFPTTFSSSQLDIPDGQAIFALICDLDVCLLQVTHIQGWNAIPRLTDSGLEE